VLRDKQLVLHLESMEIIILHGTTEDDDAIDDDIGDNEWTTCSHDISLKYSAGEGYMDKIFFDNSAEYYRCGNLIDNIFFHLYDC